MAGGNTWATTSDVLTLTGQSVTDAQVLQAQAVVEIYCGRTTDADAATSPRDLYWLKQAVAWQAAWTSEQVALHARSSFQIQSQDGVHVNLNSPHELHLAPLAARSIRNLSWFSSNRSLTLTRHVEQPGPFNVETSDAYHLWEPLR